LDAITRSGWAILAISVAITIGLWELARFLLGLPDYILPHPWTVAAQIAAKWGLLLRQSIETLKSVLAGFAIAAIVGSAVGMAIAFSRILDRLISPLLVAAQAVPKVAIAPILVLWFGFGFNSNVAVAASIAVFPVVVNTALGLRSIDPDFIRLGRSMGGGRTGLFLKVRLPAALPNIFVGLKLAMTFAVVGAVVGEFIAGSAGLGYLIQVSTGQLNTKLAFAAIVMLSLMAIGLYYIIELIERATLKWRPSHEVLITG
jgi:NitT/TauT family transport system permease protein